MGLSPVLGYADRETIFFEDLLEKLTGFILVLDDQDILGDGPTGISFTKNGAPLGKAFDLPKQVRVGPKATVTLYPAICLKG